MGKMSDLQGQDKNEGVCRFGAGKISPLLPEVQAYYLH